MNLSDLQLMYKTYIGEANHPRLGGVYCFDWRSRWSSSKILNKEIYDKTECRLSLENEIADV